MKNNSENVFAFFFFLNFPSSLNCPHTHVFVCMLNNQFFITCLVKKNRQGKMNFSYLQTREHKSRLNEYRNHSKDSEFQ